MSRIFEALQKTRAAHKGDVATIPLSAYGLIQGIEATDPLECKTSVKPRNNAATYITSRVTQKHNASSHHAATTAVVTDILEQVQSLQIEPSSNTRLVSVVEPQGPAPEAFRLLAVRLRNLQKSRRLQTVLITSTSPKEGKSLVSANLACTLAVGGTRKVLLIEGDLRCPSLSTLFGLKPPAGICDYLSGKVSLQDSIFKLEGSGIWILPAGRLSVSPVELLDSSRVGEMMGKLANWFEWVIVDAPPTLPLADTSIWERVVDGTLLVSRLGTTKRRLLTKGLESMNLDKLIGTVLNCSEESSQYGDYYYYAPIAK